MNIELLKANHNFLLILEGNVVFEECKKFKTIIIPKINPSVKYLYIDLSRVKFVDSAGLGVLVGLKMTCKKNDTSIIMLNPSKEVMDILNVAKLDSIFDIITGEEAEEVITKTFQHGESVIEEKKDADKFTIRKIITNAPVTAHDANKPKNAEPELQPDQQPGAQPQEAKETEQLSADDKADAFCKKAVELLKNGNLKDSAELYEKALELRPNDLSAQNNLALIYTKVPEFKDKAVPCWETVLQLAEEQGSSKHIDRALKNLERLKG